MGIEPIIQTIVMNCVLILKDVFNRHLRIISHTLLLGTYWDIDYYNICNNKQQRYKQKRYNQLFPHGRRYNMAIISSSVSE